MSKSNVRLPFPPEILSLCFSQYRIADLDDEDCDYWGHTRMHPDKPPLVFLQVCREWREVALNTPELWAELYLPTPPKTRDAYKSLRSAARTWLARSSARPLSLYLNTDASRNWFNRHDEDFQDKQATLAPSYLDVLLKHSTRWQRAELFLPNYRTRKSVSLFPFPLLTQLYIALPYEMPEAEDSVLVKSLFSAPHLQDLTLDYAFTQNMVLPWSTLKTLRLIFDRTNAPSRGMDDEDRFELVPAVYVSWFANGLSQASHLVRLDLYLDFYEVYPLEIDIAVTLPRLEYLRITGGGLVPGRRVEGASTQVDHSTSVEGLTHSPDRLSILGTRIHGGSLDIPRSLLFILAKT